MIAEMQTLKRENALFRELYAKEGHAKMVLLEENSKLLGDKRRLMDALEALATCAEREVKQARALLRELLEGTNDETGRRLSDQITLEDRAAGRDNAAQRGT